MSKQNNKVSNFQYFYGNPEMASLFAIPKGEALSKFETWLYHRTKEITSTSSDDNLMLSEYFLEWLKEEHQNE